MITADGRALVTDPGVSAHIRTVRNEIELDEVDPFVRWEAPDDILSKERDIYSFGMLCYEVNIIILSLIYELQPTHSKRYIRKRIPSGR